MILFLITLSVISSLVHPITGTDWGEKKTLNETKMCEIHTCHGRDILKYIV